MNASSANTAKSAFSSDNLGGTLSSGIGGIGSIISDSIKMSEIADTTDIKNQITQQQNYIVKANSNEDLLSEWSTRKELSPISYDKVRGKSDGELALGVLGTTTQGATTGLQMGGPWGALIGGIIGLAAGGIGVGVGNANAKAEQKELNRKIKIANSNNLSSFDTKASTIDKANDFNLLYNYAAYGGNLNTLSNKGIFARNTYKLFYDGGPTDEKIKNWDNTLQGQYINYAENPDSIGWKDNYRRWEVTHKKGFDSNNLGMGVDINYLNDKEKLKLQTASNGVKYLTEKDERDLQFKKMTEAETSYNARIKYAKGIMNSTKEPSEFKKAVTMSAIYNLGSGNVANKLFEDKELMNALFNGTDEEYMNIVHQYYDVNSPKVIKPRAERIKQEQEFFNKMNNKKSFGGDLFTNGLTFINNGNSHEDNPNKGVQVGVDNKGIPNLVEEGEVIWNDYVFSDRLKIPKSIQNKYKIKEMTFADAVKKLQKESEERPNDPISKDGLSAMLNPLIEEQELIRQKKEMNRLKKQYKNNNVFDGGGPLTDAKNLGVYGDFSTMKDKPKGKGIDATFLRYSPAIGSAIGATQSLVSSPDYSNAEAIENAARNILNYKSVSYKPLGDFMSYTPFDINYYTNKLQSESGALRRAISNVGGLSKNAALLAADYNAQTKLGELFRQAEEYNLAQRQKVKEFNRGTKSINSEMGLKASLANQEADAKAKALYLQGITSAVNLREALATADAESDSKALSSLFTNLGNIGTDAQNKKDRDFYIKNVIANLPMEKYIELFGESAWEEEAKRRGIG